MAGGYCAFYPNLQAKVQRKAEIRKKNEGIFCWLLKNEYFCSRNCAKDIFKMKKSRTRMRELYE